MRGGSVPGVVIVDRTSATRGPNRLGSCATVLAIAVIGMSACTSSDDASTTTVTSAEPAPTTTSPPGTSSTTTSTTAPPTTSPSTSSTSTSEPASAPVEPVIEELIGRYDAAVEAVLVDPSVTRGPTSAEVTEYLDLFVADSSFALGALGAWQADADKGRSYRAVGDGRIIESRLVELLDESASSATFHMCSASNFEVLGADGAVVESQSGVSGVRGVAVLEVDVWRLRDLTQDPSLDCSEVAA